MEEYRIIEDQPVEGNIQEMMGIVILIWVEAGQEIDNFQVTLGKRSTRSRSGSRVGTNRDRIRCFKCGEYDYFAKDCLNITVTEEDQTEQMQQMLDSKEQESTLKVLMGETYDSLTRANSEEIIDHLN